MGSHSGLTVLDHLRSSDTSHQEKTNDIKIPPLERFAYYEWSMPPASISVGQIKDVILIAVAFENGKPY